MGGRVMGFMAGAVTGTVAAVAVVGAGALVSPLRLPPLQMAQGVEGPAVPAAAAAPQAPTFAVGPVESAAPQLDLPDSIAATPVQAEALPQPDLPPTQNVAVPAPLPVGNPVAGLPALAPSTRPIEAYAVPFVPVVGRALSIVMIDDGMMAGGPQAVAALPVPVTIAIDPSRSDAAAKMAAYRAAGVEVVALLRLQGAGPTSVFAVQHALPQAVAVMDLAQAGAASLWPVDGAVNALAEAGLGLITSQAIEGADVPRAVISGEIATDATSPVTLAREIAALSESETDTVILTRLRPVVIAALRTGTLPGPFVPVSAVLR
ncbi:Divergent polysaccharide deacetylase family [Ketogulonicigenium robustum]|uniref:Divergent polysaccharide deacetylase family n=1 Tax=Ketogulonicigenium robustum TaxID=92947 RepID=A0A1W6NYF9_9RHOB|nr:hypothetical protein [Ketogulonicigenium robustum]ARO14219.1 Divergent polysaccharide deacetylase family [Ketogulonicigenium robustum]